MNAPTSSIQRPKGREPGEGKEIADDCDRESITTQANVRFFFVREQIIWHIANLSSHKRLTPRRRRLQCSPSTAKLPPTPTMPGAEPPDRRLLSGRLLDRLSLRALEGETRRDSTAPSAADTRGRAGKAPITLHEVSRLPLVMPERLHTMRRLLEAQMADISRKPHRLVKYCEMRHWEICDICF